MEPDDPSVDRDADPTRVRPDRQAAHRLPEDPLAAYRLPPDVPGAHRPPAVVPRVLDASEDRDAAPTTVRPRFWPAPVLDPDGVPTDDPDAAHTGAAHTESAHTGASAAGHHDAASRSAGIRSEPVHPVASPSAPGLISWDGPGDGYGYGTGTHEDPDRAPTTVLTVAHDSKHHHRRRDWAWVEEWRAERSAPAWGPGIGLGIFMALLVAISLVVLTSGVSDVPVLAVVFNLVIAAGMAPALWLCRSLPVLRFLAAGAAAGILVGWIAMLTTL